MNDKLRVEIRIGSDGHIWLNVNGRCQYRRGPDPRPVALMVRNAQAPSADAVSGACEIEQTAAYFRALEALDGRR